MAPTDYGWICCACGSGPSQLWGKPACVVCMHPRCSSCAVIDVHRRRPSLVDHLASDTRKLDRRNTHENADEETPAKDEAGALPSDNDGTDSHIPIHRSTLTLTLESEGTLDTPASTVTESRADTLTRSSGKSAHMTTITVPSDEPAPRPHEELDVKSSPQDEVGSLPSDNDDIASQISAETSLADKSSKAFVAKFLANEPRFRALCDRARRQLGRHRFVNNLTRLLKIFYKSLRDEARTKSESRIVELLRSKRGRQRISNSLLELIQPEEEVHEQIAMPLSALDPRQIEAWLGQVGFDGAVPTMEPVVSGYTADEDQSSIASSDESSAEDEFPLTAKLEQFLRDSWSFRKLHRDLMLMFLPGELRWVLQSVPKEDVWMSIEQDTTISNQIKSWVEDKTLKTWNWSPLEARKSMLRAGELRLFWRCSCGVRQWREIPSKHYDLINEILACTDDKPELPSYCITRDRQTSVLRWLIEIVSQHKWPVQTPASSSSPTHQYTPSRVTNPSGQQPHGTASNSRITAGVPTPTHDYQNPGERQRTQSILPESPLHPIRWILFGALGSSKLFRLAQVPVYPQSTDQDVFQAIKQTYRCHRGWLRYYCSVWQLEYCESVRFFRWGPAQMAREYSELPIHEEYQYFPRAGAADARNPPIDPHIFQNMIHACQQPCTWRAPHDCVPPPVRPVEQRPWLYDRIPKRERTFEMGTDTPIWGLEAVLAVCFTHVLAWHCAIVAGPFIFWWIWLSYHPGDLQNASIPVTIALAGISLFWAGAGILSQDGRDTGRRNIQ